MKLSKGPKQIIKFELSALEDKIKKVEIIYGVLKNERKPFYQFDFF